jgi:hypothetical protein
MLGHGPEKYLFEQISLYLGFAKRIVMANIWLFKPFIQMYLNSLSLKLGSRGKNEQKSRKNE